MPENQPAAMVELPKLIDERESERDAGCPLPSVFEQIGKVVHWEGTPYFLEVAAVLDPRSDVRPGQFVGVWHGRRRQSVLTVVQVANCRDVNPNEDPNLSVARDRLGLGRAYAFDEISTMIHRLMEGPTVEQLELEMEGESIRTKGAAISVERLVRAGDPEIAAPLALNDS